MNINAVRNIITAIINPALIYISWKCNIVDWEGFSSVGIKGDIMMVGIREAQITAIIINPLTNILVLALSSSVGNISGKIALTLTLHIV